MGNSLSFKIINLQESTRNFINREVIEKVLWETMFEEDEVFSLISRFEQLEPDELSFSISINKLKNLHEFKNNPFRELIIHSIDVYKIIYEYLKAGNRNNYPDKELFKIHIGLTDQYDENGKDYDEKLDDEDGCQENKKYIPAIYLEDENFQPNNEHIIDFILFCIIINEFNFQRTIDHKFKMCFNIFDINKDSKICIRDLKNFHCMIFKGVPFEKKSQTMDKFAMNILNEFKEGDKNFEIDFNNFQKILWSTNFISNLTIEP